jgi:hypothetical protein
LLVAANEQQAAFGVRGTGRHAVEEGTKNMVLGRAPRPVELGSANGLCHEGA